MKLTIWFGLILTCVLLPAQSTATNPPDEKRIVITRFSLDFVGQQKIEHWNDSKYSITCPVIGINLGMAKLTESAFLLDWGFGFHYLDTSDLHYGLHLINEILKFDFQIGPRFLPKKPSFNLGAVNVRFTASAQGGVTLSYSERSGRFEMTSTLAAGLHFSKGDSRRGPMIEFVVRPFKEKVRAFLDHFPHWNLRFSWVFAPRDK